MKVTLELFLKYSEKTYRGLNMDEIIGTEWMESGWKKGWRMGQWRWLREWTGGYIAWVCLGDEGGWMDGLWVDGWMTG